MNGRIEVTIFSLIPYSEEDPIMSLKILAFAGSTRKDSFNKRLLTLAVQAAEAVGGVVNLIDLKDFPLPLFDEDQEAQSGPPENARNLKTLFLEHQGLLIASPEYNSSITPLLKNTLDWVSRSAPGEAPLACFSGKVATLISASPGALGGLRGLVHLRAILGNIGVLVLPNQLSVPKAHEAFNPDGALKDSNLQKGIEVLMSRFTQLLKKLGS